LLLESFRRGCLLTEENI